MREGRRQASHERPLELELAGGDHRLVHPAPLLVGDLEQRLPDGRAREDPLQHERLLRAGAIVTDRRSEDRLGERGQAVHDRLRLRKAALERKGDRKSTRLNSSHSQISYAVFCLKKTKNISI